MPVLEGGISASLAPGYLSFHVVLRGFMFLVGIIAKGYNQLFHHVHQSLIMAISSATICLSCLLIIPITNLYVQPDTRSILYPQTPNAHMKDQTWISYRTHSNKHSSSFVYLVIRYQSPQLQTLKPKRSVNLQPTSRAP